MSKIKFFEDPELEVARLANAPEGSLNHALSKLPVNIEEDLLDLMIELPQVPGRERTTMIVVPFHFSKDSSQNEHLPFKRHTGWWDCIVVASNDPVYPQGGHRLSIPAAELVRGKKRVFDLAVTEVSQ